MRLKAPDRNHQIVTQRQQSGQKVFPKRRTAKCKLGQTSVKGRPSFVLQAKAIHGPSLPSRWTCRVTNSCRQGKRFQVMGLV